MKTEDKVRNLDAWARFFKRNPRRAVYYGRLANEVRAHVPPDTRPKCCEDGCTERAFTHEDGTQASARCAGHYVDGVL